MTDSVYERTGYGDEISTNTFYGLISLITLWGLCLTGLIAKLNIDYHWVTFESAWMMIGLGLIVPLIGVFVTRAGNPFTSLLGYHLIVIPFGLTLGPFLEHYMKMDPLIVYHAALLTGGITALMAGAAVLRPHWFENLGTPLFIALIGLILVRIAQLFVPALAACTWVDYLGAGLFSLYIGFDFWRASHISKTWDNAVDVAVSIYLDIYNLFIHIVAARAKD